MGQARFRGLLVECEWHKVHPQVVQLPTSDTEVGVPSQSGC